MTRTGISKTAVCILRVERRGEGGVLITVTTTADISAAAPGRTQSVASYDDALSLVASFLYEYKQRINLSNG